MNNLFTAALLYLMTCFQAADDKDKVKVFLGYLIKNTSKSKVLVRVRNFYLTLVF